MISADIHNIRCCGHNISMTSTTSPGGDLRRPRLVDVVDVVPKKVSQTYLLTLCNYTEGFEHAQPRAYVDPLYPLHNIHNISATPGTPPRETP